jgi:hypothetical protein
VKILTDREEGDKSQNAREQPQRRLEDGEED